jgi:hypothetical protein
MDGWMDGWMNASNRATKLAYIIQRTHLCFSFVLDRDSNYAAILADRQVMACSPSTAGKESFYFGYIAHNYHSKSHWRHDARVATNCILPASFSF